MPLLTLFLLLISTSVYAVDPIIEVSVDPKTIGTNETAEIRVSIINEDATQPPTLSASSDKFTISYRGRSSQRSINIINNNMEVRTSYSYSYQFTPKSSGTFTIPAFIVTTKQGKQIYSDSLQIKVDSVTSMRPQNLGFGMSPFSRFFEDPIDAFLVLRISQDRIPQNTGMFADLYLFSNDPNLLNNTQQMQQIQQVQFDGGLIHELRYQDDKNLITEQFGLSIYYGKIIRKFLIFPLEKGSLNLRPPGYYYRQGINAFNILGDPIEILSYPITDTLTYIGQEVTLSHQLSSSNINVSDELQLSFIIEGDGNVDFFADPYGNLKLPNLFISKPDTSLEVGIVNSNHLYMKKTFTYTIIPRQSGSYTFPPVTFSFANTNGIPTNTQAPAIIFTVNNGAQSTRSDHFIPFEQVPQSQSYYSGAKVIVLSIFLGILMMCTSFFYSQKQQRLSSDTRYARASKAKKRLQKILSDSEQAIKNNAYKDAARLIRQSILYFCADKFGISNSSSPQEIIDFLAQKNSSFTNQKQFLNLLNDLDFYAFGSTPSQIKITEYLSDAYQMLEELDKINIKS
ncbi:MAG: BatD family protein [Brevinema sp.]